MGLGRLLSPLFIACVIPGWLEAPAREWTDSTGRFHIEAEFLELKGGIVHLKTSEGREVDLPLNRLSDKDRITFTTDRNFHGLLETDKPTTVWLAFQVPKGLGAADLRLALGRDLSLPLEESKKKG